MGWVSVVAVVVMVKVEYRSHYCSLHRAAAVAHSKPDSIGQSAAPAVVVGAGGVVVPVVAGAGAEVAAVAAVVAIVGAAAEGMRDGHIDCVGTAAGSHFGIHLHMGDR